MLFFLSGNNALWSQSVDVPVDKLNLLQVRFIFFCYSENFYSFFCMFQLEDLFSTDSALKNETGLASKENGSTSAISSTMPAKVIDEVINIHERFLIIFLNLFDHKLAAKVYILDQKTSLKISLLLKQFRNISIEKIIQLVLDNANESEISMDKLRGLQRCMASEQDVKPFIVFWALFFVYFFHFDSRC